MFLTFFLSATLSFLFQVVAHREWFLCVVAAVLRHRAVSATVTVSLKGGSLDLSRVYTLLARLIRYTYTIHIRVEYWRTWTMKEEREERDSRDNCFARAQVWKGKVACRHAQKLNPKKIKRPSSSCRLVSSSDWHHMATFPFRFFFRIKTTDASEGGDTTYLH